MLEPVEPEPADGRELELAVLEHAEKMLGLAGKVIEPEPDWLQHVPVEPEPAAGKS